MKLLDKISLNYFLMKRAVKIVRGINKKSRSIQAGKLDRMHLDFPGAVHHINEDLRAYRKRAMARAKDLYINNPYAGAFRLKSKKNVIGSHGPKLRFLVKTASGELNESINNLLEDAFKKFSKRQYITMSKRYSLLSMLWLLNDRADQDGEIILRFVKNLSLDENPFGCSFEIMSSEDLDDTYNEELSNGNVVIQGVEFNQWFEIEALYTKRRSLYNKLSSDYNYGERVRLNKDEFIFAFDPTHPKQARGLTTLSGAMLAIFDVDRWNKAVLTNATGTANKMGFLQKKDQGAPQYRGMDLSENNLESALADNTEGKDALGFPLTDRDRSSDDEYGKYMDFSPGTIEELPYGYEYTLSDPKFPMESHESFLKSMIRTFTSWFGVNYNTFFGDLEGVSFSAIRWGELDERETWKLKQKFLDEYVCIPIVEMWLHHSLKCGALEPYYINDFDKLDCFVWKYKRWSWVRPLEDVTANEKAVANFWKNDIEVAEEMGGDYQENILQSKRAITMIKEIMGEDLELYVALKGNVKIDEAVFEMINNADSKDDDTQNKKRELAKRLNNYAKVNK